MADAVPIPVRLTQETLDRLDRAAGLMGNSRSRLIKLCVASFLDAFERDGAAALPLDWKRMIDSLDGRTKEARSAREGFIADAIGNKNDQAGIENPKDCVNANEDPEILAEAHALLNQLVEKLTSKGKRKRRSRSRPSPHGTSSK